MRCLSVAGKWGISSAKVVRKNREGEFVEALMHPSSYTQFPERLRDSKSKNPRPRVNLWNDSRGL